ncbi:MULTISPECIES: hypothetical protein [Burkholderia]|uniref:hypothetical protein n=1 Tax=Burkholderia TaxID=32008 RepID=UPI0015A56FC2|nr:MULTISPECIES: hypothetical protein [Burkholderia]
MQPAATGKPYLSRNPSLAQSDSRRFYSARTYFSHYLARFLLFELLHLQFQFHIFRYRHKRLDPPAQLLMLLDKSLCADKNEMQNSPILSVSLIDPRGRKMIDPGQRPRGGWRYLSVLIGANLLRISIALRVGPATNRMFFE